MDPEVATYTQAQRRVRGWMPWIAGAGTLVFLAGIGWRAALAFLIGTAAGYFNFTRLEQLVASLGPDARKLPTRLYMFFLFRFALLAGGGYVIVKFFGLNGIAAASGLFIPLITLIAEAIYELIHGT